MGRLLNGITMRTFISTLLGSACLVAAPATAQDSSIFDIPDSQSDSFIDVGAAAVSRETYVGSDDSDLLVLPYVNASYKGRFFVNPALGAGFYAIRKDKFRLAAAGNLSLGRDGKDTPFDSPLFDIDTGITGSVAARYYLPFAAIDVIGTVPFGGDLDGARLDTLLTTEVRPTDKLRITPGVRATFNTGGWINSYYGLNAEQAAFTKTPQLDYSTGLSTIGVHGAAYYTVTDTVEILGIVNYSMLVGDIKDSPLTPSNSGLTAAIAIARKF